MVDLVRIRHDARQKSLVAVWPDEISLEERNTRLLEQIGWQYKTYSEKPPPPVERVEDGEEEEEEEKKELTEPEGKPEVVMKEEEEEEEVKYIKSYSKLKLVKLEKIDIRVKENNIAHHTDVYDITKSSEELPPQLILRRGQPFEIDVYLDRPLAPQVDDINVVLEIGNNPMVSKGTQVCMELKRGLSGHEWGARVECSEGNVIRVRIETPPDCIVGCWNMHIDSLLRPVYSKERSLYRFTHPQPIYILFNPWVEEDDVYMANRIQRDECVMNDFGKIFFGNYMQIAVKYWLYGQFEHFVLNCVLQILDDTGLEWRARGDAMEVTRALCKLIVSTEQNPGLLEGNWSGDYKTGTSPATWIGSTTILEQYWHTRRPVKYGQCAVFAALSTTILRALGIPCRPVTNFSSAHNCDSSKTLDFHWNLRANAINELNGDSIWSCHSWNEVWMRNRLLSKELWGWQAFDTTIQKSAKGFSPAGPCPVLAIKKGLINTPYNTDMFFAELNADAVQWYLVPDGMWKKCVHKHRMGRLVVTKKPRLCESSLRRSMPSGNALEMDNITTNYKNKNGSEEDRCSIYRANAPCCQPGVFDNSSPDVKFQVCQPEGAIIGLSFDLTIRAQNCSHSKRNIRLSVCLYTSYYTGDLKARILKTYADIELGCIKAEDAIFRIPSEDYIYKLSDEACFKVHLLATVKQTGQIYAEQLDFRLQSPLLILEGPRRVELNEEFHCIVTFRNPLPTALTCCSWMLGGTGIQKISRRPHKDLDPFENVTFTIPLTASALGTRYFLMSFYSRQIMDISSMLCVEVHRSGSLTSLETQNPAGGVMVSDDQIMIVSPQGSRSPSPGRSMGVGVGWPPEPPSKESEAASGHSSYVAMPQDMGSPLLGHTPSGTPLAAGSKVNNETSMVAMVKTPSPMRTPKLSPSLAVDN